MKTILHFKYKQKYSTKDYQFFYRGFAIGVGFKRTNEPRLHYSFKWNRNWNSRIKIHEVANRFERIPQAGLLVLFNRIYPFNRFPSVFEAIYAINFSSNNYRVFPLDISELIPLGGLSSKNPAYPNLDVFWILNPHF